MCATWSRSKYIPELTTPVVSFTIAAASGEVVTLRKSALRLFVAGCATAIATVAIPDVPKQATDDVSGVWLAFNPKYQSSIFGHYAFLEDGRKCSLVFDVGSLGTETFAYLSRWDVDDHVLITTFGLNNDGVPLGSTDHDTLEQLTDQRIAYIETGTVMTRMPDASPVSICHLARAILVNSGADSDCQDPGSGMLLGTWISEETSESECSASDIRATLRVFGGTWPNFFDATLVQRSDVRVKEECRGEIDASPEDLEPVQIEGGIVSLTVTDNIVTISSSHRNEILELIGDTMIGGESSRRSSFRKAHSEIRYDAREGQIGWQAINRPLCEEESQALDLVQEFARVTWFRSTMQDLLEAAVREAEKENKSEVTIKRSAEIVPLKRFDGMTFEEILQDASSEISAFLTERIGAAQQKLEDCEGCSEEEVDTIRETIAERREEQQAWVELQRKH